MNQTDHTNRPTWAIVLVCTVFFLLCAIGVMLAYLSAEPPLKPKPMELTLVSDREPMRQAMTPEAVGEDMDAILSCGSRFIGQPGFYAVQDLIRQRFNEAGLEIIEHPVRTVAPQELDCRLLTPAGQPLTDVDTHSLFPNQLQPIVTPEEGLRGKLVLITEDLLREGRGFENCIAVFDHRLGGGKLLASWLDYAAKGFKAVIYTHGDGLDKISWTEPTSKLMIGFDPINYPRVLASPSILDHLGEEVVLHCRQQYANVPNLNILGLMRAGNGGEPADELIIVHAFYDSCSYSPSLAPGVAQALRPAALLSLVEGLKPYQDQMKRDVLFVATGSSMMAKAGLQHILSAIGSPDTENQARLHFQQRKQEHIQAAERVARLLKCFETDGFMIDPEITASAYKDLPGDASSLFDSQLRHVLFTRVMELSEPLLEARLAFLRTGEDIDSPEYRTFLAAKKAHQSVLTVAGYPPLKLVRTLVDRPELAERIDIASRLLARYRDLASYHAEQLRHLDAALRINALAGRYREKALFSPSILPRFRGTRSGDGDETVSIVGSLDVFYHDSHLPSIQSFSDVVSYLQQNHDAPKNLRYESLGPVHYQDINLKNSGWAPSSDDMALMGWPSFSLVNTDRINSYATLTSPVELPGMRDLSSVRSSLWLTGETVLALAFGNGRFTSISVPPPMTHSGKVYVSGVGRSLVPSHTMQDALIGCIAKDFFLTANVGSRKELLMWTDPYGFYEMPLTRAPISTTSATRPFYSPLAVGYDADGHINYIQDEGQTSQGIYRSLALDGARGEAENANIIVFRASPVAILDTVNPQSLKNYVGVEFISVEGMEPFETYFQCTEGVPFVTFLKPDDQFYVKLKAGSPDNELVQETRAFMLGVERGFARDPASTREIDGPGYLVADNALLLDVPRRVAQSMYFLNHRRFTLQDRHRMVDELTRTFHSRVKELIERAGGTVAGLSKGADQEPTPSETETQSSAMASTHAEASETLSQKEKTLLYRDAVTYATLNHPVLRESIREAVLSILWYLCLLVPFAFFFEKLAFGFSDVRKQLLAIAIIFLIAFGLLKLLHPAFEMIRSSMMILLGFIIILISGGITVLFSGKFSENFEQLKARRGQVAAAEVNVLGVIATAFMLGLNNMHRRKVRTGLTCATLVLITFAMICFTSTQSDIVDSQIGLGKAAYQGFLIKNDDYKPIDAAEFGVLQQKYGDRFMVSKRGMLTDGFNWWNREIWEAEVVVEYTAPDGAKETVELESMLSFGDEEPLAGQIEFATANEWFPEVGPQDPEPIILPEKAARELGITADMVDNGNVLVKINGVEVRVHSLFTEESLEALRDLDNRSILPIDIQSMPRILFDQKTSTVLLVEPFSHVQPSEVFLSRSTPKVNFRFGLVGPREVSVAVWLKDKKTGEPLPYKGARFEINQFLEQSGDSTYYGLDGIAYRGKRARETTLKGLIELIIPLVLGALTVLNTIRGSVYERREEIFVYNAVGIAPRYVFFMFFAEAFVYSVVGTVLGYFLSQGTGRVLTELNLTGGLNMTFTSFTTVLASLAIMVAVFLSTLFPALKAMEIAAPAEESGWDIPEPVGDKLTIHLPFTFDPKDRFAVLEFFNRYFVDHGEGSSGAFFCSDPQFGVADYPDELADGAYIPRLKTTVWLKPFDLGVSQFLQIDLPTDPETGEYIAHLELTRLSGQRESWIRLNRAFLRKVREHFLHWRAVAPHERAELFELARDMIRTQTLEREAAHG